MGSLILVDTVAAEVGSSCLSDFPIVSVAGIIEGAAVAESSVEVDGTSSSPSFRCCSSVCFETIASAVGIGFGVGSGGAGAGAGFDEEDVPDEFADSSMGLFLTTTLLRLTTGLSFVPAADVDCACAEPAVTDRLSSGSASSMMSRLSSSASSSTMTRARFANGLLSLPSATLSRPFFLLTLSIVWTLMLYFSFSR